ncbi:hypothetical protein F4804DRAFT_31525 [Jackrogersella minutella]|nr:hypothetical protein F4804DRAFT_31525 [Jackrogersella minutella]
MTKVHESMPQSESFHTQHRLGTDLTLLCCQHHTLYRRTLMIRLPILVPSSIMSTRRRVRDIIDATRDHLSTMSGRYRISPTDFDQLYELYQEDTSAKGLYEFIVDHPITHSIAGRLNVRPIDVLATMVGKTADVCQQELQAEIQLYQVAEKRAAEFRARTNAKVMTSQEIKKKEAVNEATKENAAVQVNDSGGDKK